MTLKVVNLGLPKTGTTTLARALRRAGLHVADHRIRRKQTADTTLHGAFVAELLYRGIFDHADPSHLLQEFDALTEISLLRGGKSLWPQMDFAVIDGLRKANAGVKFLASNRDSFALSQSMLAWSDLGLARLPEGAVPGLPRGYGETSKERETWINGHYAHLRALFRGDPDFLEYDIADPDAPAKIGAHIGLDLPWWGRANVNWQVA